MKTLEFTDQEIITLEKAVTERISHKRRSLRNLEKNNNGKAPIFQKEINQLEQLYEKLLEIVPDKYMFGRHKG